MYINTLTCKYELASHYYQTIRTCNFNGQDILTMMLGVISTYDAHKRVRVPPPVHMRLA